MATDFESQNHVYSVDGNPTYLVHHDVYNPNKSLQNTLNSHLLGLWLVCGMKVCLLRICCLYLFAHKCLWSLLAMVALNKKAEQKRSKLPESSINPVSGNKSKDTAIYGK
jgi:hypothetical protein